MDIQSISLFNKIAGSLLLSSAVVHIIGLSSPYWLNISGLLYYGLWEGCIQGICGSLDSGLAWLNAVRAFEILALLLIASCIGLLFLYIKNSRKVYIVGCVSIAFVSGVFIMLGVIIYAAESEITDYSWAFGMEIVAAIMVFASGSILFAEFRSPRSNYQAS